MQAGYVIGDRCLRPALVAVAKGGAKQTAPSEQPGDGPPKAANDDFPGGGPQGGREPPRVASRIVASRIVAVIPEARTTSTRQASSPGAASD